MSALLDCVGSRDDNCQLIFGAIIGVVSSISIRLCFP